MRKRGGAHPSPGRLFRLMSPPLPPSPLIALSFAVVFCFSFVFFFVVFSFFELSLLSLLPFLLYFLPSYSLLYFRLSLSFFVSFLTSLFPVSLHNFLPVFLSSSLISSLRLTFYLHVVFSCRFLLFFWFLFYPSSGSSYSSLSSTCILLYFLLIIRSSVLCLLFSLLVLWAASPFS